VLVEYGYSKCVMLFLVSTSEVCPQSPSEALFHVCLQSNWKYFFSILLSLPYITKASQPLVSMTMFSCGVKCLSNCFI